MNNSNNRTSSQVEPILSIVVPVFNEEANITVVIEEMLQALNLRYQTDQHEILIVNDGSSDKTGYICDGLATQYPSLHVFHHAENQGVGGALRTGFKEASGVLVSFLPGDGQVRVDQVLKLLDELNEADLIVSDRQNYDEIHGAKAQSIYRKCLTSSLRYILIGIFGFDPSGKEGIFLIRNTILQQLQMTSKTGLLAMEIILQCYRKGCIIKESLIWIHPRLSGQSKVTTISNYIKYLWEIGKLRFRS